MANLTYFVALPFERAQSRFAAIQIAAALASSKAGAIAFARSGDPAPGEYENAVILARYGGVIDEAIRT
jgi:hypothetical protein